jgi:methyltransferase
VILPLAAGLVAFLLMAVEAGIASRHDRVLRALGAVEPAGDVYPAMQIGYPAAFLAMLGEGAWRGTGPDALFVTGSVVFAVAKGLKYWAIASLGTRWTFRVLVPPGSQRTIRGPYRWIAHPNYVGVALELAGLAIAMHARVAGPIGTAAFIYLMWRRVRIEDKALAGQ